MRWLNELWSKLLALDNEPLLNKIEVLEKRKEALEQELEAKKNTIDSMDFEIDSMGSEIEILNNEIEYLNEDIATLTKKLENDKDYDELGEEWNKSRPKVNLKYRCRYLPNKNERMNVDPRIFITPNDSSIPKVSGKTYDEIAKRALTHVINNITYVSDSTQFKESEVWLFPFETWKLKKGDCEDGAILLYNIMLKSGVPYSRVRLNAGNVQGGGHAWVTYKKDDGSPSVILDWCYWPDSKTRNLQKTWKDAEKYFSTWWSWNQRYIFKGEKK